MSKVTMLAILMALSFGLFGYGMCDEHLAAQVGTDTVDAGDPGSIDVKIQKVSGWDEEVCRMVIQFAIPEPTVVLDWSVFATGGDWLGTPWFPTTGRFDSSPNATGWYGPVQLVELSSPNPPLPDELYENFDYWLYYQDDIPPVSSIAAFSLSKFGGGANLITLDTAGGGKIVPEPESGSEITWDDYLTPQDCADSETWVGDGDCTITAIYDGDWPVILVELETAWPGYDIPTGAQNITSIDFETTANTPVHEYMLGAPTYDFYFAAYDCYSFPSPRLITETEAWPGGLITVE